MILKLYFSKRLLMATCVAFAILIALTLMGSFSRWHKDWDLAHAAPAMHPAMTETDKINHLIASIPENPVFGKSMGQMPITNLQMIVTGIVKVSDQSELASKAYISIDGHPGKIFKAGDPLPYGVKIYAISHDAVILENNEGHFEKLPLPREKLIFKPGSFKEHV